MRTICPHAHACLPALELKIQSGEATVGRPAFDAMEHPPPLPPTSAGYNITNRKALEAVLFCLCLWTSTSRESITQSSPKTTKMVSPPLSIINHSLDCLASETARTNRNPHLSPELPEMTPKPDVLYQNGTKGSLTGSFGETQYGPSLSVEIKPDGCDVKAKPVSNCQNLGLEFSMKRQRNDISCNGSIGLDEKVALSSWDDITLLSVSLRSNQTKRNCRTIIPLWSIKHYNEISTHFAHPGTILPRPESPPLRHKGQEPRESLDGASEELQVSEVNTDCSERKLDTSAAYKGQIDKIFKPSFPANDLQRILASGYASEVDMIPKSLLEVMPLRFLKSFREDSRRCIAWTVKGQRCKIAHSIGLLSRQLEVLVSFELSALYQNIEELIEVFLCPVHRKVARKQVETWADEFKKLPAMQAGGSIPLPQNKRLWYIFRWVRLLSEAALSHQSLSSSIVPPLKDAIHRLQKTSLNSIQFFKPHPSSGLEESLSERLMNLMNKPLQAGDIRYRGSIYIFWHRGNFGKLKIGRSTNVHRRLQEWSKQCKREMGVHYPNLSENGLEKTSDTQQVPHISRVEALVHLELMQYRRIEPKCAGCSKSHVEWFEVPEGIAISVVRKWTSWMATLPYERRIAGSQEQWILKSEELSRVDRLCQLRQSLPSPPVPTKRQHWISSRRRSSAQKTN